MGNALQYETKLFNILPTDLRQTSTFSSSTTYPDLQQICILLCVYQ